MAAKVNLPVKGVIENMSWFIGDDGRRYELFGSGGGQALADEVGVPLLGQLPLVPAVREVATTADRSLLSPRQRSCSGVQDIAERVAELRQEVFLANSRSSGAVPVKVVRATDSNGSWRMSSTGFLRICCPSSTTSWCKCMIKSRRA
jgi:hypothetical protein